ncbi:protein TonB [Pseudovibrio denitrificans]|uniref:Protein TonB n=1 Tax=Pseudovibrio denitrificans TaxID=258256 RepID=A0A1I6ZUQ5_9HYPH|nr:protein TonB [Pseudovibrio denitrificans]
MIFCSSYLVSRTIILFITTTFRYSKTLRLYRIPVVYCLISISLALALSSLSPSYAASTENEIVKAELSKKKLRSITKKYKSQVHQLLIPPMQQALPKSLIRAKVQGRVLLGFSINRSGQITETRILKSSGNPMLDRATLSALKAASPLPPIPKELPSSSIKLKLPVRFKFKLREPHLKKN